MVKESKEKDTNIPKSTKNRGQFQKGRAKTGGKVKGSLNKRTVELKEKIEKRYKDFDPIIALIEIGLDSETPVDTRVTCFKEVAKYIHPQRKAVEVQSQELNASMSEFMKGLQKVAK